MLSELSLGWVLADVLPCSQLKFFFDHQFFRFLSWNLCTGIWIFHHLTIMMFIFTISRALAQFFSEWGGALIMHKNKYGKLINVTRLFLSGSYSSFHMIYFLYIIVHGKWTTLSSVLHQSHRILELLNSPIWIPSSMVHLLKLYNTNLRNNCELSIIEL